MKKLLTDNLRLDAISGFLVFLIALPLCLGIAKASGFPPIAGLYTAIVGGLFVTFISSAQLTIKGPAAGLIVIALGAVEELGQGDMIAGYKLTLAVGVIAGIFQMVLGLLKTGKYADFFPSSVIHGMLAAIGIIIMAKQIHVAMGVVPEAKETIELIEEIPFSFAKMNPEVAFIGLISLLILFLLPFVKHPILRKLPAPLIVLVFAIPLSLYFDLSHAHDYDLATLHFHINPAQLLVALPSDFFSGFTLPDFSQIGNPATWKYVIMFALVGSIESLLSTKAIDTLDPQKRKTNMNRDIIAVGIGNIGAAFIGGLPMISEIVRSSANINAGGKTKMSNFFHGLFLFLFAVFAASIIQKIPNAALAAMLIFTGFKLASPKEFKHILAVGMDQFLLFFATLIVTLLTDLLVGVTVGICLKILLHFYHGGRFNDLFKFRAEVKETEKNTEIFILTNAVFTNYLGFKKLVDQLDKTKNVKLKFGLANIVDHTFLENVNGLQDEFKNAGGSLIEDGFERHNYSSFYSTASRVLIKNPFIETNTKGHRMDRRQFALNLLSAKVGLEFLPMPDQGLLKFNFGDHSIIRASSGGKNLLFGKKHFYQLFIADIEYEWYDGLTKMESTTTVAVVNNIKNVTVPDFILDKHNIFSVFESAKGYKDINFEGNQKFSKKYFLRGIDEPGIRKFFEKPAVLQYFDFNDKYSLEAVNGSIMFKRSNKLLSPEEVKDLITFIEELMFI